MNAPGKGLLKTVSILFIIGGAIMVIAGLILALGSAALASLGDDAGAVLGGLLLIVTIIALLDGALMLVLGIIGVGKRSGDPSKAGYYIVTGIILCVLGLLSIVLSIANGGVQWTGFVGFVLPILYIVGGVMNKKVLVQQ